MYRTVKRLTSHITNARLALPPAANVVQDAEQHREAPKVESLRLCCHGGKAFELETKPAFHGLSSRAVFDPASPDVKATPAQK